MCGGAAGRSGISGGISGQHFFRNHGEAEEDQPGTGGTGAEGTPGGDGPLHGRPPRPAGED